MQFATIILFPFLFIAPLSAQNPNRDNIIGIFLPVVYNISESSYRSVGPRTKSGQAVSYGINIKYSRTLFKKIHVIVGSGYYKQRFSLRRSWNYSTPTGP